MADALAGLDSSGGRVVLVRGEAGIGKSAFINRFLSDSHELAHTLTGACDDLLTPQPFGPLWDIARKETFLSQLLTADNPRAVMEGILGLLSRSLRPTILVLEDTQWADEATLDLIKFLGRRIVRANGLLMLTYRDVAVDASHPLRHVLGELPPQSLLRVQLKRLTRTSVEAMIEEKPFDIDQVLALTGGNPLFVSEILASGTDGVPLSVSDSVLARAAKLSPGARRILDLVSVVPGEVERSIVDQIVESREEQLAECSRQGLLRIEGEMLSFPHDLQRRAIESSLAKPVRRELNRLILDALGDSSDAARLVHHAREANDIDAIVEFAPRAARIAMGVGSTSEAVSHFRALRPHLERIEPHERAAILADWAREEEYLDNPDSIDLFDRAISLYRSVGDVANLARTLTLAGTANSSHARPTNALAYSQEAVTILEQLGPSKDLAEALSGLAFLEFFYTDSDEAVLPLVNRALAVAEEINDLESRTNALNVQAHLVYSRGDIGGMTLMEESLRSAENSGDHWGEVRALSNMAGMYGDVRDIARATDFARRARDTAARYEIRSLEMESRAMYCEFLLWKGDWAAAEDAAAEALGSNTHRQQTALRVLGTISARRGRKESRTTILQMWSLVEEGEGATIVDTAATALAEYLWLSAEEDPELVKRLSAVLSDGIRLGVPWPSGAFAFWMWKLGLLDAAPEGTADFYGWIINGEYSKSVEFWRERGIPYEEGLALMHGDEGERTEALRIFEDLGAAAIARKVRRSLMDDGVKIPRGRSRASRDHVAGLTERQAEVLALVANGLTNTEIADELFVSYRTVENHVSAILMKLDAPNREAAVDTARSLGLVAET